MRVVSTTPLASKYLRCRLLLSHVAAAAVPHAADATTPMATRGGTRATLATRDAARVAPIERRESICTHRSPMIAVVVRTNLWPANTARGSDARAKKTSKTEEASRSDQRAVGIGHS